MRKVIERVTPDKIGEIKVTEIDENIHEEILGEK